MLMSCHHNAGRNHKIKTANRNSENVAKFKYLGTTVTNQDLIHEEIKVYQFRECLLPVSSESIVFSPNI
jgi:hypothetical protein